MSDRNLELLPKETYLRLIQNSVGSALFRSVFVRYRDSGITADILKDGELSCAYFVSSILYLVDMIDAPHTTVNGVERALKAMPAWRIISDHKMIMPGDVLFWESITFPSGEEHAHVGFALTPTEAVSADFKQKTIARHPIAGGDPARGLRAVYRHDW